MGDHMRIPLISTAPDRPPPDPAAPTGDGPSTTGRPLLGLRTLTVLFMAESLALALLQLPLNLDFEGFASMDQGANLTVQGLLDRGLIPTVDFGYQYGLLPLLAGRAWFALLGRTPQAYAAAMLVFDLLIAWGLARCAHALRVGPAGIALILCTMSSSTLSSYINLAHAFEATLICHALAEHAGGRRPRALALLTVALFAKPVMAYVYGLLLVLLIVRAGGFRGLVRAAVPAAIVGALLVLAVAAWFGPGPVVHSLLPLHGAESYKILNYGFFFGRGRNFWLPAGVRPRHYIFTPAGHYLAGSVILVAAAAGSAWRLARGAAARADLNAEVVACCGIMHIVFLTMFYGNFMSYTYYYYILIIGLAALAARGPRWALVIALIAAAGLAGNKDYGNWLRLRWRDSAPSAETFGLWSEAGTREEWRRVRQVLGNRPGSFITTAGGCMELFLPQLAEAEDVFLVTGWPLPGELRRKVQQVADAEVVLVRTFEKRTPHPNPPAPFREVLAKFDLAWSGDSYLVYERRRPPASRDAEPAADPARASPPGPPGATTKPHTGSGSQPAGVR
jgi:hypothetical protein